MAYSYNKFLKALKDTDKTIRLFDNSNSPTYVLNPFSILRVFITNTNLNISLSGNKTITLDFDSTDECKDALLKLQQYIDILKKKTPINVDVAQKNYVQEVIKESTGIVSLNNLVSKEQSIVFSNIDPNIKVSATSSGATQSGRHDISIYWSGVLPVDRGGLNNISFSPQEILMYDHVNSSVISSGYKIDNQSEVDVIWTADKIKDYISTEYKIDNQSEGDVIWTADKIKDYISTNLQKDDKQLLPSYRETPSGLIDGVNKTFYLSYTPVDNSELLFINGLLYEKGEDGDYTISANEIVFKIAPSFADNRLDKIVCTYNYQATSLYSYRETPYGVIDGVNKKFYLSYEPIEESEHIFINGLLSESGLTGDYVINGNEITFRYAPEDNGNYTDKIICTYKYK
jgi:hypothetical protein